MKKIKKEDLSTGFNIGMEPALYQKIKKEAKKQGRVLSNLVNIVMENYLKKKIVPVPKQFKKTSRFNISMKTVLHNKVKKEAKKQDQTLRYLISKVMEKYLNDR